MINVTCVVKNEKKNGTTDLIVTSVEGKGKNIGCVEVSIGDCVVKVYGPELIQAIDNAMSTEYEYMHRPNYGSRRRLTWEDEDSDV